MATERWNASCTPGAQEFGKSTIPNRSGACARPVAGTSDASTRPSITSRVEICIAMVVSCLDPIPVPSAEAITDGRTLFHLTAFPG